MDPVKPAHYSALPMEPLDFILVNQLGFLEGNIIKYLCRYQNKGGLEDLRKAQTYLERLLTEAEKKMTPSARTTPVTR